MTERIVVIGADAAGMSAASQAKRIAGNAVEIVAFERGSYSSYSACGIPYWVAGDVDGPERLIARSPEAHRRNGIDLRMRTEVEMIDLAAGRVLAHDLAAGRSFWECFDSSSSRPARSRCDRRCPAWTPPACSACRLSTTAPRSWRTLIARNPGGPSWSAGATSAWRWPRH